MTEYYAVMQWLGDGVSVLTLVEKPEKMQGIWIADYIEHSTLYVLADGEALSNLSADDIIAGAWHAVRSYQAGNN